MQCAVGAFSVCMGDAPPVASDPRCDGLFFMTESVSENSPPRSGKIPRWLRRSVKVLAGAVALLVILVTVGCYLILPSATPKTFEERISMYPRTPAPVSQPVTIRWNERAIPFIEAETDEDLAFALGTVHAHLRLAQIEFLRRVSQGRLSESAGPFTVDLDHSLRILNFGGAADQIEAEMPEETRVWVENFVAGLNWYVENSPSAPAEYRLMGWRREPFTVRDILTISRLAGTDVSWIRFFRFFRLRDEPKWPEFEERLNRITGASAVSFTSEGALPGLLGAASRSGSNSVVIAGERSASGKPMIANDPHVGFLSPPLWMLVGYRSPSYELVGVTIPGLPIIGLGRNRHIAWGGTNMLARSSDLVSVDPNSPEIETREETIGVRFWFDRKRTIRETPQGPLISDSPLIPNQEGEHFALRWIGRQPSDEITAFLKASRSSNFREFRAAFESYAVSGQNMLAAAADGDIGHVMAVRLPVRPVEEAADQTIIDVETADRWWEETLNATTLPAGYNPKNGYIVSANNQPTELPIMVSGGALANDRVERLEQLVEGTAKHSRDSLAALQKDVVSPQAAWLVRRFEELSDHSFLKNELAGWDGEIAADSRPAAAYHLLVYHLISDYYGLRYGDSFVTSLLASPLGFAFLEEDAAEGTEEFRQALASAAEKAASDLDAVGTWGAIHRLRSGHYLSNIPYLGSWFPSREFPAAGNSGTVMKTGGSISNKRHRATFGATAGHISDLADPDENYFVLLGGQDGWVNSEQNFDQLPLWHDSEFVRFPLTEEAVAESFRTIMTLEPAQ